MRKLNKKKISFEEFDKKFDSGEDMGSYLSRKKTIINKQTQRINIDFPISFLRNIDKEAHRIGVARTALIKIWLAERLEQVRH